MNVSPHLIPRAALVRLRALDLGGLSEYYVSTSAESSSSLAAGAPEATNMYVLAYGVEEGLAPGERLEAYGGTVRLVRTMAFGYPRGATGASVAHGAVGEAALREITLQLNRVAALQDAFDARSVGSSGAGGAAAARDVFDLVHRVGAGEAGGDDDGAGLSGAELAAQLERVRRSDAEVVVAEWRRREPLETLVKHASGDSADDLLVENGVCFSHPEQGGLRVLRAARLAFMSMIERTANGLREAQHRRAVEELRPLAVLDASGLDFSFSHAAVQATVELGLHDASQCSISFLPLTRPAARGFEGGMSSFVRQVVHAPGQPLADPFAALPLRSFDVAAYTTYLDVAAPHPPRQYRRRHLHPRTHAAAKELARVLAVMRRGASLLVSFVPTPSSQAAVYAAAAAQGDRRREVAAEMRTVAEAKACIAAAISRCGRWGCITDELLPMVDCPQGGAISLVITVQ